MFFCVYFIIGFIPFFLWYIFMRKLWKIEKKNNFMLSKFLYHGILVGSLWIWFNLITIGLGVEGWVLVNNVYDCNQKIQKQKLDPYTMVNWKIIFVWGGQVLLRKFHFNLNVLFIFIFVIGLSPHFISYFHIFVWKKTIRIYRIFMPCVFLVGICGIAIHVRSNGDW